MALGTDDPQPPGIDNGLMPCLPILGVLFLLRLVDLAQRLQFTRQATAQHDIGAAPGHIGGDRNPARPAGLDNHFRLAGVVLGVQDLVFDIFLLQNIR